MTGEALRLEISLDFDDSTSTIVAGPFDLAGFLIAVTCVFLDDAFEFLDVKTDCVPQSGSICSEVAFVNSSSINLIY